MPSIGGTAVGMNIYSPYKGQRLPDREAVERRKEEERLGQSTSQVSRAAGAAKGTGAKYAVAPTGEISYASGNLDEMREAARLQAEAEQRRLGMFGGLFGAGGQSPLVGHPGGVGGDEAAARAAAFARAKDQSGKVASAALRSLQEQMAGRGTGGSGIQDLMTAGVVQGAQAPLQELTRDQLMMDLNRAADISDLTYQGNITQRGQNINMLPQLLGLYTARY